MITLLNGDSWGKEEIETQMYDDDFYYNTLDITKVLSSSSLKDLLNAPEEILKQLKGKKLIRKIYRDFMNTDKFKSVHENLKKHDPKITKREVMETYLTLNASKFYRQHVIPILKENGFDVQITKGESE